MEDVQIDQTYSINAPIGDVWEALVDPTIIEQWSGAPAEMSDEIGYAFALWDGDIFGTNTTVEEPELLEQDWFGGDWDEPSKVKFELSEDDGVTTVHLTHWDLPQDEVQDFEDGWSEQYMGPLKEFLEE